ncbi:hypothetical protein DRE_00365 [Drechslerella stenobrocha 248]|uniref:NAD(P)-binding protein n=1 Tax=Drechslerella stenobrocha 248 TaxID=1043628 RepID=W7I4L6_9PEZI|nr:hypothetical protein DRE_00365 [Drechslerella stenobrocha 248]
MVKIDVIRASNADTKDKLPAGLVALFVGATSGIGEHTLRTFFEAAPSPRVYFIGRSQSSADRIIASLQPLNPNGHLEFIQADVSLLKNVDEAVKKFSAKEKELNLLMMSQGFLTLEGRVETAEGLDTKLALNYFSRARFIQHLLPALTAATSTKSDNPVGARVISVLSAGMEGPINFADFELKTTFSLRNAGAQAVSFNSASAKYLATQHPSIGFIHSYPGAVETPILESSRMPWYVKVPARVVIPFFRYFIATAEESGQRHYWLSTAEKFKTGGWLVDQAGDESATAKKSVETGVCDEAVGEKVWKKSLEIFEKVEKEGKA